MRRSAHRRQAKSGPPVIAVLLCLLLTGCVRAREKKTAASHATPAPIVVAGIHPDELANSLQVAAEFTRNTGIPVHIIPGEESATSQLLQYRRLLARHAATPDVFLMDVTWPAALASQMADQRALLGRATGRFLPAYLRDETVNHRLIALPVIADVGMLYYRTDLLRKYGYRHPPRTWQELTGMATVIQHGERAAGHSGFWGYVWEGAENESLTCNALEWQASAGGGHIVETDHTVSVDNPQTVRMLKLARSWLGTISPPGVTAYEEEDARNLWNAGNAAFMRNWPHAWSDSDQPDSAVKGKFGVTVLPSGGVRHAGTLGGWSLAVSRYSRHPHESARFVLFMTSPEAIRQRAAANAPLPALSAFYDPGRGNRGDPDSSQFNQVWALTAVARPSAAVGSKYPEVSAAYFHAVHQVLTGERGAADAMARLQRRLMQVTGYPAGPPRSRD